jgi:hypothetical protein
MRKPLALPTGYGKSLIPELTVDGDQPLPGGDHRQASGPSSSKREG